MDGNCYAELLKQYIIPFRCEMDVFQQDNAPPHKTSRAQQLFQQAGIDVMDWPPYSPDLNPIENIWSLLKKSVSNFHPQTLDDLESAIVKVWWTDVTLSNATVSVIQSMPQTI